jgi:signal transduction histidine kinase
LKTDAGEPVGLIGCCHDVTEKRELREELLKVTAREQRRIGQELHDGTGQELTGLQYLAFSHVRSLSKSCPGEVETAQRIADGLQRALQQVRALSKGLLPVELDAEGLLAALTELTVRVNELNGAACSFVYDEPIPMLDHEVATQLYRIAQEALNNAVKHARAGRIVLHLTCRRRILRLEIQDDGTGLRTGEPRDGLGLRIMASRAELIGGTLKIEPGAARGTRVSCELPWSGGDRTEGSAPAQ